MGTKKNVSADTDGLVLVIVVVTLIAQVLVTADYSNSNTDGLLLVIILVILIAQVLGTVDYGNSSGAILVSNWFSVDAFLVDTCTTWDIEDTCTTWDIELSPLRNYVKTYA